MITRGQKRQLEQNPEDTCICHIKQKIKSQNKQELDSNSDSNSEYNFNTTELESELESETESETESEIELENESEIEFENIKLDSDQIREIIKNSIKTLIKNKEKEESKCDTDVSSDYEKFYELIDSVYEGNFFERNPLEYSKKQVKETITIEEIQKLTEELKKIKSHYSLNAPSIIDILHMNVSIEQKQKLLEKIHCLANSEVLTSEYNTTLKFLTSNMSNINPELIKLEEQILNSANASSDSYRTKILTSKMSFNNKVIAYKKLEIMETYEETDTSEYAKYKAWMDGLLTVPFGIYNESGITKDTSLEVCQKYIKNVRDTLDKKLSFLEKPKDQIINIVTQMIRNPDVNINAIGLYGPKGTGKTSIVASIAEALGRPYATISLGGESDASSLTGHGFTYVGSSNGRLIDILCHTKTMNPIVLIDELDKVSETQHGKEIIGTLIHLTDSTTNNKYNYDKYFSGIEFDLSKILFIFTYNDPSKVDRILADRLFKIKVDNYNVKEKIDITKLHIIPTMINKFKFNTNDIIFSENAIKYLVNSSNTSEGMREIKYKIEIILSRINTLLLTKEEDNIIHLKYKKLYSDYKTLPVTISETHIDTLLDESISLENDNKPPFNMYI